MDISVEQGGEEVERTRHLRDERGRIVETTIRGAQGIENLLFEYAPEDDLIREEYRIRGSLERITHYYPEGQDYSRIEELYRKEEVFMKIYFRAGEKVKEEFLKDGQVMRVREFE